MNEKSWLPNVTRFVATYRNLQAGLFLEANECFERVWQSFEHLTLPVSTSGGVGAPRSGRSSAIEVYLAPDPSTFVHKCEQD